MCQSGMVEMIDYIYDNFEVFELLLDASYGQSFRILWNGLSRSRQNILISIWTSFITGTEDGEVITEDFIHIMTRALFESNV